MNAVINDSMLRGELRMNEPMAKYTSWRVGGCAEKWYKPADRDDLISYIHQHTDESIHVVGLGSNLLVRDGGLKGTVIVLTGALDQLVIDDEKVYAEAGVPCAKLARQIAQSGLVGAEFFAGIPGTVGGALAMNAGAWGSETWNYVSSVELIDQAGDIQRLEADQFDIAYRHVEGLSGRWFIAASFQFEKGDTENSRAEIKALLAKRAQTQPTGVYSCGSVFRNPPNDFAARLIEKTGLKGLRVGGAHVSEKHANFIINDQQATALDIEQLILLVQQKVQQATSVQLQPEVRIIGDTA